MRKYKFSELKIGDKFVSSAIFLGPPFHNLSPIEDEDLVVMEKVGRETVRMCYSGRLAESFPSIAPCVKVRL